MSRVLSSKQTPLEMCFIYLSNGISCNFHLNEGGAGSCVPKLRSGLGSGNNFVVSQTCETAQ